MSRVPATILFTAAGWSFVVEAGEGRCYHSEEVHARPITVPEGSECDLCLEVITEPAAEPQEGE